MKKKGNTVENSDWKLGHSIQKVDDVIARKKERKKND